MTYFKLFVLAITCLSASNSYAAVDLDSLRAVLHSSSNDSVRYRAGCRLYDHYEESNKDSALHYSMVCLEFAQKNKQVLEEINFLGHKAYQLVGFGQYAAALQCLLHSFSILSDTSFTVKHPWRIYSGFNTAPYNGDDKLLMLSFTHHMMAILMWRAENEQQAISNFIEARKIAKIIQHRKRQMLASMALGRCYFELNMFDSAFYFAKEAERLSLHVAEKRYLGQTYLILGNISYSKGNIAEAEKLFRLGLDIAADQQNINNLNTIYQKLTALFIDKKQKDSAIVYALRNREIMERLGPANGLAVNQGMVYENIYKAYRLLAKPDSVSKYLEIAFHLKDSLYKVRIKTLTEFQNAALNEQLRLQNAEKEKIAFEGRIKVYTSLFGLLVVIVIAVLLLKNNLQRKKANQVLLSTLSELKATQTQLIHSEKMASLGELTAGIAHEIQNPLNFVNNFSDLSKELIDEMNDELEKGDVEEAKFIAADIKGNLEKINHHGKRADSIVRGMLQHSRSSSGEKQETDINKLADEYLRLSYHGLRSKDKDFNANIDTSFDESIGKIWIAPQEIGRVILNLVNNAFYAVHERSKTTAEAGYKPSVSVITKRSDNVVTISISDNGDGIPDKIKDKIFNPFFTTKPTGQGTGLGLSLSYDIVKAHGGDITVTSVVENGTAFSVRLPL